jgi:putative PIG3 family NAD(P)H quinone oxidoreductase
MQAVLAEKDQQLRLTVLPRPKPSAGEVLIKVAAAGVNRPDLVQRAGGYPAPPGAPETLGLEVAGTIQAAGAGVTRWKPGDQVCALLAGGGYAEYALADQGSVLPIPAGLSLIEAAGLVETAMTVFTNVFEDGALKAGETFLVHGGCSGIGTTAIQMAKAHGARVFATAGDDTRRRLCETLGAERGINYKTEDFEKIVKEAGGADVILDMVGGPYLAKNISLAKPMARISIIATLQGAKAEINLTPLYLKRVKLTGSTLRSRSNAEKARIAAAVEAKVWPWVAQGFVKPLIDSTFPLAEAEAAHQRIQSGAHAGKIVLVV